MECKQQFRSHVSTVNVIKLTQTFPVHSRNTGASSRVSLMRVWWGHTNNPLCDNTLSTGTERTWWTQYVWTGSRLLD